MKAKECKITIEFLECSDDNDNFFKRYKEPISMSFINMDDDEKFNEKDFINRSLFKFGEKINS